MSGAVNLQPEALTSVHALDERRQAVRGRQAGHAAPGRSGRIRLSDIYDDDPVRIGADTDVVDVAVLMSDYNLITIPVVDEDADDDRPDHRR